MLGAFLFPKRPSTAPGDTILWFKSENPVSAEWQLEQDCPAGCERFLSWKMAFPSCNLICAVFTVAAVWVVLESLLQAWISTIKLTNETSVTSFLIKGLGCSFNFFNNCSNVLKNVKYNIKTEVIFYSKQLKMLFYSWLLVANFMYPDCLI